MIAQWIFQVIGERSMNHVKLEERDGNTESLKHTG